MSPILSGNDYFSVVCDQWEGRLCKDMQNTATRVERLGVATNYLAAIKCRTRTREIEIEIEIDIEIESRERRDTYARVYVISASRSSARDSRRRMHKGRRDRGIGLDQSRFSLVHRFFFSSLFHSLFLPSSSSTRPH